MRPGMLTTLTASIAWNSGVGTATFNPPQFGRYMAVAMGAAGGATSGGESCILTSLKDLRREQQYVLGASVTATPARGVPLAQVAGLRGQNYRRWRGNAGDTEAFVRAQLPPQAADLAMSNLRKFWNEAQPDCAFIPVDGQVEVVLKRLKTGDEPTSLSLVVIDMGKGDAVGWTSLPPWGRPYWFGFAPISLGTAAATVATAVDKLVIPADRYAFDGQQGSMLHRSSLLNVFLQSDGSLDAIQTALIQISSATEDLGKSRFEPAFAPAMLVADPDAPYLGIWDARRHADDPLALDYSKALTAAASWAYWVEQFVASRLPKGG